MSRVDIFEQDRPFRLKIIALLLNPRWTSVYGETLIKPEYFGAEDERAIVGAILDYHRAYNRPPSDPEDVIALIDDVELRDDVAGLVYDIYDDRDEWELDLPSDVVKQFAREQEMKIAILDSVDDIKKGDLSSALTRVKKAYETGRSLLTPGIDVVGNVDDWLYDLWSSKVRTGWVHVDKVLEGGLSGGENMAELGVIMAPPNFGKSMSLVNLGYSAASIGSGLNVIHFTHELASPIVAKRYAARMLFRFVQRHDDKDVYKKEFLDAAKRLMPGNIRIIGGARRMKLEEMSSHIERLIAEGFDPGLIIDDYADLIIPSQRRSQYRFELSDIYKEMRAMAGHYGIPVWTATQSTRSSLNKEVITLSDIAEDIGKAAIADVIIALCQTPDEYRMDRCRLYMAKVRDGRKHAMIDAKFYSDSQSIVTTGFTKFKEEEEDV